MTAYEMAQQLGLQGSDEQQVAILQTLTYGPIQTSEVRRWAREQGLWYRQADGQMGGILQAAYSAATAAQKNALDLFYAAVWGDSATLLRTTEPQYAGQVWQIVQVISGLSADAAGLVNSFYSLDGGRPYKNTTVSDFAEQRSTAQRLSNADAVFAELMNDFINPAISATDRSADSVKAAFVNAGNFAAVSAVGP